MVSRQNRGNSVELRQRIRELRWVSTGDLESHPGNWREHPQAQADALAGVLREVGVADALIAYESPRNGGKLTLIDGHLRKDSAPGKWPVLVLDVTDAEADYLLVTLDPLAGMATAAKDALDALLSSVSSGEPAVQQMLADMAQAAGLYLDKPEAPEPQLDKAEELRVKWGVESGQLWQLGEHRLLCGDSSKADDVERLLRGTQADTIVFDPPYDAESSIIDLRWLCQDVLVFTDHRHLLDCVTGWPPFRSVFVWDGVTSWYTPGWPLARGKFCLWFGGSKYDPDGAHYGEPDRAHKVSNTRGEYNYVPDPRGKHLSTVFQSPNTQEFDAHAHAKPVDWMRMLIGNCTRGGVFDPFAGGGTSIVVCESLKRTCLSIEIDPGNVAVILERVSAIGLEPRLAGTLADRS